MKAKYSIALMAVIAVMMIVTTSRASVTDDRIVSSAKNSYIWNTYLTDDDIKIESVNGAVTLTGVVAEIFHKFLAEKTVESLPGVISVANKLTVKGEEPTPNSDAWIKEKVKSTLSFHRSTSAIKIDVSVKDGNVTLRGVASSQAQKDLTTEYVKDIDGVKNVDNQMTVSLAQTTTKKVAENIDDASITAQIKYALMLHRSTSILKTKVDTKNGAVTLQGKAKSKSEIKQVTNLVKDINGVKSVNNRMTVE